MTREEITSSQEYKAEGVALDWYKSLNAEQVGEIHITDAYAEGVIHGWNSPNWISVEEKLPEIDQRVWIFTSDGKAGIARYDKHGFNVSALLLQVNVTHWMEIVPPRKEDE